MASVLVELVKYDMDKTKKRKRANFSVDVKSEAAVIQKLEKIHKGEKVQAIHELVWGEEVLSKDDYADIFEGTVKFFDEAKGFGFIRPEAKMDDLFFHISALGGEIVHDGDSVEFEIGEGPKGAVAIKIKLIS